MNTSAINEARRKAQDTALAGLINDEARIANELQAQTGCTRTVALTIAKQALEKAHGATQSNFAALAKSMRPTCDHFTIKCTTNPEFIEHWVQDVNARERCDELNRNLAHPAYFIA